MWIAKPVRALSESELSRFPKDVPLAQTLDWARAIESLGSKTYAVFETDLAVGGIVYESQPGRFECVNGPALHWDDSEKVAAQFSTFVLAVTKLSKNFQAVTLRPRWPADQMQSRLLKIPFAVTRVDQASTWVVPVQETWEAQLKLASPRLRRTLKRAEALTSVQVTSSEAWVGDALDRFVQAVSDHAKEKSFSVPPTHWFRSLVQGEGFFSVQAESSFSKTELLIAVQCGRAHYLFGVTQKKPGSAETQARKADSGRDSTSTVAHFRVLEELRRQGIQEYDLNGYVTDAKSDHPYFGVAQYKKQFGGSTVDYVQAVFEIEA
ncbi:MAG: hypothetical protein JNL01_06985 [Bdellovibrionales bacterium]|nr:hypothetical protein [Bdellovibrionales bacterium]